MTRLLWLLGRNFNFGGTIFSEKKYANMTSISYGKIASNVSHSVKVTRDARNKIGFSREGLPPVCCDTPMDEKGEISPEMLQGYLDFFKEDFKKEIQSAICYNKQEKMQKKINQIKEDF